jgi:acyl-CoA synthetase (AMP-forming)/AMP-acid ligase II
VIFRKNQTATVDQILERLKEAQVARQKLPEKIIFVDDFPKTASGKVKKDLLRLDVLERLRVDEKLI